MAWAMRRIASWSFLLLFAAFATACPQPEPPIDPACGDGFLDFGEACDDGNRLAGDGCSPSCQVVDLPRLCGNGTLDRDELCDDGNAVDGDGCDTSCTPTACGNGVRTEGESCDDGKDRKSTL